MKEKSSTFALDNDEETTALATDSGKVMPILEGEDAERFIRLMHENEEHAKELTKQPMSKKEAEKKLMYEKMFLKLDMQNIEERKRTIKKLEEIINSAS